jgi:succinate dehydrogenase/fumarate reductase cytochrome b subunit
VGSWLFKLEKYLIYLALVFHTTSIIGIFSILLRMTKVVDKYENKDKSAEKYEVNCTTQSDGSIEENDYFDDRCTSHR